MTTHTRLLCTLTLLAACGDEDTGYGGAKLLAPPTGTAAYVTISNARPAVGSRVTVTTVARQAAVLVPEVGAFTAALDYDRAGLHYEGEAPLNAGFRALSEKDGTVRAAGARSEGFERGVLFAVTFRVIDPAALASLRLHVTELRATDFADRLPALRVSRELHQAQR